MTRPHAYNLANAKRGGAAQKSNQNLTKAMI